MGASGTAFPTFFVATESSKQQTASVDDTLLGAALTGHLILDQPEVFHPKTETSCRPILALGAGEFGGRRSHFKVGDLCPASQSFFLHGLSE